MAALEEKEGKRIQRAAHNEQTRAPNLKSNDLLQLPTHEVCSFKQSRMLYCDGVDVDSVVQTTGQQVCQGWRLKNGVRNLCA